MLCMLGLVSIRCIMVFLLCDEMLRCSEYYIHIHTYDLKYMAVPQNFFFLQADFSKYPATQGRDSGSGELDVTGT